MRTCLCVDDDPLCLRVLTTTLRAVDPELLITQTTSSVEGAKFAIDRLYDFAFIDYMMGEMIGPDVLRYINPSCVKIVITACIMSMQLMKDCLDAGADGFIQKPFQAVTIEKIINGVGYVGSDTRLVEAAQREGISSVASKRYGRVTPFGKAKAVV